MKEILKYLYLMRNNIWRKINLYATRNCYLIQGFVEGVKLILQ